MKPIRTVQYNILCSALAQPNVYPKNNPKDLEAESRVDKIWDKISAHIEQDAIICLQEISETWISKFHTRFNQVGYTIFYSLYGDLYNDSMGVAIAYPTRRFESINSEIINIGKSLPPKPRKSPNWLWLLIVGWLCWLSFDFKKWYQKKTFDPYIYAQGKRNRLLCAALTDKQTHQNFVISTYHMPCAYRYPKVMDLHSSQAITKVLDYAQNYPVIFAGDFNICPSTHPYSNLINCLSSAYKEFNGQEPNHTCRTYTTLSHTLFSDCLDYILYKGFRVLKVSSLPQNDNTLYPNKDEPSDHLLLWTDLEIEI